MSLLPLVIYPDPILKKVSEEVTIFDNELKSFMDDMLETMYHENGAGIAAVQVGVLKRIMILDVGKKDDASTKNPIFFINPEIIHYSEEMKTYQEGCLSFPGVYPKISRPKTIIVKYLDYNGAPQESEVTDWLARGVQHEMNHLNGITILDQVSKLKGHMMIKKVQKHQK